MPNSVPKVARLPPPAVRIIGYRLGFGRYALWTPAELAANTDGVRYLCWLLSQRWFRQKLQHKLVYMAAREALIDALQEGLL